MAPAAAGDVICVLQFDAASVAGLERLLARRPAAEPGGAARARAAAGARDARRPTSPRAPSTRSTAGSSSATTGSSIPSSGRRPSSGRATRPRSTAPPPVWERLAESGLRTLAIDPYESRPPRRAEGTLRLRLGLRRPGRAPALVAAGGRRPPLRAPPRPRPAGDRDLRTAAGPATCSRCGRSWSRRRAGSRRWPRSCWRASASTSPGSRSAPPTSPATSSGTSRSSTSRPLDRRHAQRRSRRRSTTSTPPSTTPSAGCSRRCRRGADVIVTSAVGMDVNTSRADLLPGMLAAVLAGGPVDRRTAPGRSGACARRCPRGLRGASPARSPTARRSRSPPGSSSAGSTGRPTRAFAHPADNQGYVRLNLRGRERDGIVDPGEADALIDEIAAGLATFTDPDGAPAVAGVVRGRATSTRARTPTGSPTSSSAGPSAPATSSRARSTRRGSARSGARAAARAARATTRRATPGRWWCPGRRRSREPTRPARLVDVAATVCEVTGADRRGLPGEPLLRRAG